MDPANLLFIIAFIGLPIAFGIWAIMSRGELKRRRSPATSARPKQPAREAPAQEPPPARRRRKRKQRQPAPQPAQPTEQYPAVRFGADQQTMQAPATPPPAPPAAPPPGPAPEEPVDYGPSGTTQEFPVIADGMMPPEQAPPAAQETVSVPAVIPAEELQNAVDPAAVAPPPPAPSPAPEKAAQRPASYGPPVRRRFYPVRYAGRSRGVVSRMTPLDRRQFAHRSRVRS